MWFTEPPMLVQARYIKDITGDLKTLGWYDKMDVDMRETLTLTIKFMCSRDGYGLGLFINLRLMEDYGLLQDIDGDGKVDLHDATGKPLIQQLLMNYSKYQKKSHIFLAE